MKLGYLFLPAIITPFVALAQNSAVPPTQETTLMLTPETKALTEDKSIEKRITTSGFIQSFMYLTNSENNKGIYFQMFKGDLGVKYSEGIVQSAFSIRFKGNHTDTASLKNVEGGVQIRKAQIGLNIQKFATLTFGRIAAGGANAWGPDALSWPDGLDSFDAGKLAFNFDTSIAKINTGFLYGSPRMLYPSYAKALRNSASVWGAPFTGARGYAVNLGAKALEDKLSFDVIYGANSNMVTALSAVDSPKYAANVSQFEASLGFETDGINGGIWLEKGSKDKDKVLDKNDGGKLSWKESSSTDTSALPKTDFTLLGFGGLADTRLLGIYDLLQRGGRATVGASFAIYRDAVVNTNNYQSLGLGLGYIVAGYTIELNYQLNMAKEKIYGNSSGVKSQVNSSKNVFLSLMATY